MKLPHVKIDPLLFFFFLAFALSLAATVAFAVGGSSHTGHFSTLQPNHSVPFAYASTTASDRGGSTVTFTRATASTNYTSTATVAAVTSGTVVVGAPLSYVAASGTLRTAGASGAYVGNANTFTALQNEDLATTWSTACGASAVAVTVNDATTDPAGTTVSDELDDDSGANAEGLQQNVACTATSPVTATIWYRDSGDAGTPTPSINIDGTSKTCTVADNTWRRCEVTDTSCAGSPTAFCIYPAGETASATGAILVFRPQSYETDDAIELDPAVAASTVTVNAERLDYGSVPFPTTGSACLWMNSPAITSGVASDPGLLSWDGAGTAMSWSIDRTLGDYQLAVTKHATDNAAADSNVTHTGNVWRHLCWTWTGSGTGNIVPYSQGAAGSAISDTFGTNEDWGTTLTIGQSTTGSRRANAYYAQVQVYDRVLSASAVKKIFDRSSNVYSGALEPRPSTRDVMLAAALPVFLWEWARATLPELPLPRPYFYAPLQENATAYLWKEAP